MAPLALSAAARVALRYGPLVLVGFAAGALWALSHRPGLSPRTRRACRVLWVVTLLAGAPLWLFFAATVGW
ncbi:MAG TPA: hypothetical protein VFF02_21265 [Anaeromyxobacteraceae bacterium]|nr:hypothetical protein [Anaeromyxobacteraceae bacterium]